MQKNKVSIVSSWTRLTWAIDRELDSSERYLDQLNLMIRNEKESQTEWIRAEAKEVGLSDEEFAYNLIGRDLFDIDKEFPRRVYSSFVISAYSLYEEMLLSICNVMGLYLKVMPFDNKRIEGGIHRAKLMIEEQGVSFANDDWSEAKTIRLIRNKLAHNVDRYRVGGSPKENKSTWQITSFVDGVDLYIEMEKEFYKYLDFYQIIELRQAEGRFNITYQYCQHVLKFIGKSVHSVLNSFEQMQPELKQF